METLTRCGVGGARTGRATPVRWRGLEGDGGLSAGGAGRRGPREEQFQSAEEPSS